MGGARGEEEDASVVVDAAVVAKVDACDSCDEEGSKEVDIYYFAERSLGRMSMYFYLPPCVSKVEEGAYLADRAKCQCVVERVTMVEDTGCCHNGCNDVVDALECFECLIE